MIVSTGQTFINMSSNRCNRIISHWKTIGNIIRTLLKEYFFIGRFFQTKLATSHQDAKQAKADNPTITNIVRKANGYDQQTILTGQSEIADAIDMAKPNGFHRPSRNHLAPSSLIC